MCFNMFQRGFICFNQFLILVFISVQTFSGSRARQCKASRSCWIFWFMVFTHSGSKMLLQVIEHIGWSELFYLMAKRDTDTGRLGRRHRIPTVCGMILNAMAVLKRPAYRFDVLCLQNSWHSGNVSIHDIFQDDCIAGTCWLCRVLRKTSIEIRLCSRFGLQGTGGIKLTLNPRIRRATPKAKKDGCPPGVWQDHEPTGRCAHGCRGGAGSEWSSCYPGLQICCAGHARKSFFFDRSNCNLERR